MQESRTITKKSASNLALAFVLLPREKRDAMSALYAFCREVDDVADEDQVPIAERENRLNLWRRDIGLAFAGGQPAMAVNRDIQNLLPRYPLKLQHFEELLDGVQMDLTKTRYTTWKDLELYCYRVASVVGLLSIEIFGYTQPATREYAVHLGKALQLTNILRDVRTDAERGRIYLPGELLSEFKVSEGEILRFEYSPRFAAAAAVVHARARHYYQAARETLPAEDRSAMIAAELMGTVYWRLLQKLESKQFQVFGARPTRLNRCQKIGLVLQHWLKCLARSRLPSYGV